MFSLFVRVLGLVMVLSITSCSSQYVFVSPLSAQSRDKEIALNLYIGDFGLGRESGDRRWMRGYPDHQVLEDDGLVAWWSLKTDSGYKYYYVRSRLDEKLGVPRHYPWSEEKYRFKVSFGPMYLEQSGMNEHQKTSAVVLDNPWGRKKNYLWGKNSELHYTVVRESVDIQRTPRLWQSMESIELTKYQYNYLDSRCGNPWWHVRCFIDDKFPKLTKKQYQYIKDRVRKDDDKRLNGAVNPPAPSRGNPWA